MIHLSSLFFYFYSPSPILVQQSVSTMGFRYCGLLESRLFTVLNILSFHLFILFRKWKQAFIDLVAFSSLHFAIHFIFVTVICIKDVPAVFFYTPFHYFLVIVLGFTVLSIVAFIKVPFSCIKFYYLMLVLILGVKCGLQYTSLVMLPFYGFENLATYLAHHYVLLVLWCA